jgi:hypothetical protein
MVQRRRGAILILFSTAAFQPYACINTYAATKAFEMLDHVIPLNERHLMRLSHEYISYYHEDRTHIGLDKETPSVRPVEPRPMEASKGDRLAGDRRVAHRYGSSAAA